MNPIRFRGYGVGAEDVTIIAERITHWHYIGYNGNSGTEIHLDTGKSIRVEGLPHHVEKAVREAVKGRAAQSTHVGETPTTCPAI